MAPRSEKQTKPWKPHSVLRRTSLSRMICCDMDGAGRSFVIVGHGGSHRVAFPSKTPLRGASSSHDAAQLAPLTRFCTGRFGFVPPFGRSRGPGQVLWGREQNTLWSGGRGRVVQSPCAPCTYKRNAQALDRLRYGNAGLRQNPLRLAPQPWAPRRAGSRTGARIMVHNHVACPSARWLGGGPPGFCAK